MSNYVPFNRDQSFLLPPDLKAWLPEDVLAHFVVAAVERVPLGSFLVAGRTGGKAQYHPRLMLALLIYSYANGIFSSRRIERATYRDIGVRFVAANLHPDHDTIAVFRRNTKRLSRRPLCRCCCWHARADCCASVPFPSMAPSSTPMPRRSVRYAMTERRNCAPGLPRMRPVPGWRRRRVRKPRRRGRPTRRNK